VLAKRGQIKSAAGLLIVCPLATHLRS